MVEVEVVVILDQSFRNTGIVLLVPTMTKGVPDVIGLTPKGGAAMTQMGSEVAQARSEVVAPMTRWRWYRRIVLGMMEGMAHRISSQRFVGRAAELSIVDAAIGDLTGDAHSARRVMLISGEAGIGKTRLLGELMARADLAGARVAYGACLEHGAEIMPMNAIVEIVNDLSARADAEVWGRHPQLAHFAGRLPSDQATGPTAARLGGSLRELLTEVTRRQPLVIAIEDLHWADRSTHDVLAVLATARRLERLLIVGTYRDDELHRRHPLVPVLAEIERGARPERIELHRLDQHELGLLAEQLRDSPLTEEALADLHRRSSGNAFFAEELLNASGDDLPESVRHVVLARTHHLGDEAVAAINAASTLAAPIDAAVLAAASGLGVADCSAAVDLLCAERLLVDSDRGLRFRHELVREVFLDELLPGERTRFYGAAAAALEQHRPERLGEIARLRFQAADLTGALHAAVAAGTASQALGAAAEASEHYGRALDIWQRVPDPEVIAGIERHELVSRAARAASFSRDYTLAVELGREVTRISAGGDPWIEGQAWFDLSMYLWEAAADGYTEAVERAEAVVPDQPPTALRARVVVRAGARRQLINGPDEQSFEMLQRGMAMANDVGAAHVAADAQQYLGLARAMVGDRDGVAEMWAALEQAITLDDGPLATKIALNVAFALAVIGEFDQALRAYDLSVDFAERHDLMGSLGMLLECNALDALEALGQWDRAEDLMTERARRERRETVERWATAARAWHLIRVHRGEGESVLPILWQAYREFDSGHYTGGMGAIVATLVEAMASDGQTIDPDLIESTFERLPPGETVDAARLAAVAIRNMVSDNDSSAIPTDTADRWIARLDERAQHHFRRRPPILNAWLDQARAEIAEIRGDHPAHRWDDLVAAWSELGCVYYAAYARFRSANALLLTSGGRSATDRSKAVDLLTASHAVATGLGAQPLLDLIDDLARRARLDVPDGCDTASSATAEPRPFGLTERELEVLELVTAGRTNGEIGTALFINTKTASVHVSNILRKLEAANRIQAAAIARERGLF